jgi:predicted small metal-binding protein
MKKLTCKDLGGPCDAEIMGNSFEEMGQKSHDHVMEQIKHGDQAHQAAADKMKNASPEEQRLMMESFEKKYNEAPSI